MRCGTGLIVCAAAALVGCSGTTGPQTVENPDPSVKIPLEKKAIDRGDHSVVPQLIKDLRSDDAAIRMCAIDGLRKLTGQSLGYNFYEDEDAREPATRRWEQWLASGHR